jgi:hypothetical protein
MLWAMRGADSQSAVPALVRVLVAGVETTGPHKPIRDPLV